MSDVGGTAGRGPAVAGTARLCMSRRYGDLRSNGLCSFFQAGGDSATNHIRPTRRRNLLSHGCFAWRIQPDVTIDDVLQCDGCLTHTMYIIVRCNSSCEVNPRLTDEKLYSCASSSMLWTIFEHVLLCRSTLAYRIGGCNLRTHRRTPVWSAVWTHDAHQTDAKAGSCS